jgi:hypothetical protein
MIDAASAACAFIPAVPPANFFIHRVCGASIENKLQRILMNTKLRFAYGLEGRVRIKRANWKSREVP